MGMQFVRFLAACYLTFNIDFSNVTLALASLPPMTGRLLPRRLSIAPGQRLLAAICCHVKRHLFYLPFLVMNNLHGYKTMLAAHICPEQPTQHRVGTWPDIGDVWLPACKQVVTVLHVI